MDYTLTRKVLKLIGAELTMIDQNQQQVAFIKMKGWKLREEITAFTDNNMQKKLFSIKARQIIDFGATYDITDPDTGNRLGSWRRKGLKSSFIRDTWELLDPSDNQIGTLTEDSVIAGLARRFVSIVSLIFPQKYSLKIGEQDVANFQRSYNLIRVKYDVHIDPNAVKQFDYRIIWAGVTMLGIMESSKS